MILKVSEDRSAGRWVCSTALFNDAIYPQRRACCMHALRPARWRGKGSNHIITPKRAAVRIMIRQAASAGKEMPSVGESVAVNRRGTNCTGLAGSQIRMNRGHCRYSLDFKCVDWSRPSCKGMMSSRN